MNSSTIFGSALIALFGTVALASTDAEAQQFNRFDRGRPAVVVTQPGRPVIVTQPARPVFVARPVAQPVYTQPVYTQPVYAQPVAQPVYVQPMAQPVYQQPVYAPRYGRGRDLRAQAARAEAMRIQAARDAEFRAQREAMERARLQGRGTWGHQHR